MRHAIAGRSDVAIARSVRVRGIVQGVGFRPFVYRLAHGLAITGWVLNDDDGVEMHLEGEAEALETFVRRLREGGPEAATIDEVEVASATVSGLVTFEILASDRGGRPTTRISPDLPACACCLTEMRDPNDPRYGYLYINCTDCGPRYSIIEALPYDRERTTMRGWAMDELCTREYHDPASRRFHAQPVACAGCGPRHAFLDAGGRCDAAGDSDAAVVARAVEALCDGRVVAIKGIGGYHLACDARQPATVMALRERKFRKEKPFALMARDPDVARSVADISAEAEAVLSSAARPITLVPARTELAGVAPGNPDVGLMLPYTPLHHALFDAGAPELLVMTSANRSSEPIAFGDDDALDRLGGIADAFLVGERPIARRVEDSVVRCGPEGSIVLRRSRGYAPGSVTRLPTRRPVLALGADLKNTVTLVVDGEAFVSQHLGDLAHLAALDAFRATVGDLLAMYELDVEDVLAVADCHPQYWSTLFATELGAGETRLVQHHRAHVASVISERQAFDARVIGLALDGTGYGDDGTIWGGEIFVGGLRDGLRRVGGLRQAALVGGDAAAGHPVQAAVGFLAQIPDPPDFAAAPFGFPDRYEQARRVLESGTRTFSTSSTGRLFDTAAALLGFVRPITFEGQAAMWLEHLALRAPERVEPYELPYADGELDFRPLLGALIEDRAGGREPAEIARAFHVGLARGLARAVRRVARGDGIDAVVASGGVMQNALLSHELAGRLRADGFDVWTNRVVPPNDGGVSLGQAALAAFGRFDGEGVTA